MVEEEVLSKSGPELFRELVRVYPVAEVEDYFKAGAWRDEMMKTDLQLVEAHRKEAGAPEPPALEEVKLPEMPTAVAAPIGLPGGVRPPMFAGAGGMAVPQIARPMGAAAAPGAAAVAGGPAAELRLIALFVAKWKLDPTGTKMILAKLTPARRRYVIQHFKATAGADPNASLAQFVATCEKTNAWAAATAAPVAAGGVKRPLAPTMTNPALDPSKRPRLVTAMTLQRPGMPPRPAVVSARPGAVPTGVRPPMRPVAARPPVMVPRPKAAEKPGALIRNLLQRF